VLAAAEQIAGALAAHPARVTVHVPLPVRGVHPQALQRAALVPCPPDTRLMVPVSSTVVVCDNCGRKNRVPAAAKGTPRCGQCHEPLPWIIEASDEDFAEVVESSTIPVLIDLWAPWCGPCRMVSPALKRLIHQYKGRVKLVKVNVDESPRIAQRFAVQGIPTLLVMNRGQVLARQTGAPPEPALRAWLEQAITT
jgi:thioredoxin 2